LGHLDPGFRQGDEFATAKTRNVIPACAGMTFTGYLPSARAGLKSHFA